MALPPAHFLTGHVASELSWSFSRYSWRADLLPLGGCTASADSTGATGHARSLAPAPVRSAAVLMDVSPTAAGGAVVCRYIHRGHREGGAKLSPTGAYAFSRVGAAAASS